MFLVKRWPPRSQRGALNCLAARPCVNHHMWSQRAESEGGVTSLQTRRIVWQGNHDSPGGILSCCCWKEGWGEQSDRCSFQEVQRGGDQATAPPCPAPQHSGGILGVKTCHVASTEMNDKPRSLWKPGGHPRTKETLTSWFRVTGDSCTFKVGEPWDLTRTPMLHLRAGLAV